VRKATELLAAGLDPDRCTIFVQSHVPAHTEMAWLMECTAGFGELRRMTQFKEKSEGREGARAGLFTYPCLMAADILLYDTDRVPVGDDQRQHLELTRDLATRWNSRYGPTFVVPEAAIPTVAARVMDLQEPTAKMSKSRGTPQGRIDVMDDPADIVRKIKRAVTDADGQVRYSPAEKPGVSNLLELLAVTTGADVTEVAGRYTQYGPLKADTAEAVVEFLRPFQERLRTLEADPGYVGDVIRKGAAKAAVLADEVLRRARDAVGLVPRA
jgi:tryptophanyl-tRNA synthetase